MKTSTTSLADITTRADRMIAQFKLVILPILNGLTAGRGRAPRARSASPTR